MAYEMVMPYHLHMPSYFLETFTEYPYINIGGFCKLELFGKEIVIYTSCTACSYQDNDKDNNPYNSTLLFIHFSLSGFFVCKYRQISVSFLLLTILYP